MGESKADARKVQDGLLDQSALGFEKGKVWMSWAGWITDMVSIYRTRLDERRYAFFDGPETEMDECIAAFGLVKTIFQLHHHASQEDQFPINGCKE